MSVSTLHLRRASRVVERNALGYKHNWIILVSGFVEPFLYLLGIGYGVGSLVGTLQINGHAVAYAVFVAPALMASAAMNGAVYEMGMNFYFKLREGKTFLTMMSTPMGIGDIVAGEILWALIRGTIYATAFVVVMLGLGLIASPWAVLAIPGALAIGATFACIATLATTFVRTWSDFDLVQIALLPMFLFSATFYPLSAYPEPLQVIVQLTPLYHGVDLLRAFTTGAVGVSVVADLAYLAITGAAAFFLARRRLVRKLLV